MINKIAEIKRIDVDPDIHVGGYQRAFVIIENQEGNQGLMEMVSTYAGWSDIETRQEVYAWPEMAA